jgi:hypothetical protein
MKLRLAGTSLVLVLVAAWSVKTATQGKPAPPPPPPPPPKQAAAKAAPSDADMIKSAMSAAPMAVAKDATIMTMNEKGEMRTLRQGTNGWTCLPDSPSPGPDPMCADKTGAEWLMAWAHHMPPPADKMGFVYMLAGGSDASNEDPYATAPKPGTKWIDSGPHVMVLNVGNKFAGYPTTHDNVHAPWVMWPNTPYAHLMLPVAK